MYSTCRMGEKGRGLYGLGESPSNSLLTVFEFEAVDGARNVNGFAAADVATTTDGVVAMDGAADVIGAWV